MELHLNTQLSKGLYLLSIVDAGEKQVIKLNLEKQLTNSIFLSVRRHDYWGCRA